MSKTIDLLRNSFELMEEEGKVDLDISLPILNRLSKEVTNLRDQKIKMNIPPQEAFEISHLSLIALIVLKNMERRIRISQRVHDNPGSVLDSLKLLPDLKRAIFKIDKENPNKTFLDLASQIQLNASQNNLFDLSGFKGKNLNEIYLEIAEEIVLS